MVVVENVVSATRLEVSDQVRLDHRVGESEIDRTDVVKRMQLFGRELDLKARKVVT